MSRLSGILGGLRLPVIGAPMFIVSGPALVLAQCRAGIIGTMPSLNVRDAARLEGEIAAISDALADEPGAAPFGINLIAHKSNPRLAHNLDVCVRRRVPIVITSLGPSAEIVARVHAYGGLVFHDVTNIRHARKAIAAGVDGLIAVAAGAGGHAGTLSPFALCQEIRQLFDGLLILSGAISTGAQVAAARCMGADLAYVGTRFIATAEANAPDAYKAMLIDGTAADIAYTGHFSGIPANYLRPSIVAAGLDPDRLGEGGTMVVTEEGTRKAWRDIWGAGQGIGAITDAPDVAVLVERMAADYAAAIAALNRP